MNLRPYQNQAIQAIISESNKGINRQLISMPTGCGKTVVFAHLPQHRKGQTLVLAHRDELIDQAIDKIWKINPSLKISKEKADDWADINADVIVGSVQTLGTKNNKRIQRLNPNLIKTIITDEAHHSTAQSYKNIYDYFELGNTNNSILHLGFTATPTRSDGKALAEVYEKITYSYSLREAIQDGWLVDIRGIRVNTKTSLDEVKTVAGDFAQDMLSDAVNNKLRNELIVQSWLTHGKGRTTVVFAVDIAHSKELANVFKSYGVSAEAVWGNDPYRAEKIEMLRKGTIKVLVNCNLLTEGFDAWEISCIVLARPTKSGVLFTQMVGRGTRLDEKISNLKEYKPELYFNHQPPLINVKQDCIVIDVVDNTSKHSLVTLPTLMGMSANLDLKGHSLVGSIQKIEEAQKQYHNIDFSNLTDITKLQTYISSVDLYSYKVPEMVENNSKFNWMKAADGGFIILLEGKDEFRIRQNLLDKYELIGYIKGKRYKGVRDTLEEAFPACDQIIIKEAWEHKKLIDRDAKWRDDKPTQKQLDRLAKMYRGKALPVNLTKGQAANMINEFIAKRRK